MDNRIIDSSELKKYFLNKNYTCMSPHQIVNNNDTVFLTAGIQPILSDFRGSLIPDSKRIYLSQPVIRTQFANSISEGTAIAFTNLTTAGFNISEREHNDLVKDCLELFCKLGLDPRKIEFKRRDYEGIWGDLLVIGKQNFYYYDNIELGDTTFFTSVTKDGEDIGIDTMSDVGFGLERIRWCLNNGSYFNLYSDSSGIDSQEKAFLSAIALLTVNDVKPANKNAGYRTRMFSKKLVELLDGRDLTDNLQKYLLESIKYWRDWQEVDKVVDIEIINKEYTRNSNRHVINKMIEGGYKNIEGIDINVSRDEFVKRLMSSGLEREEVEEIIFNKIPDAKKEIDNDIEI